MAAHSQRALNACRAEAAVEEVNTAVNKLHAEVEVGDTTCTMYCMHDSFRTIHIYGSRCPATLAPSATMA
jgi:hypothetical protein